MHLSVRGGTKYQRKYTRLITKPICNHLLGSRLANNITLDIVIRKNLKKKERALALCVPIDENLYPRFYQIDIESSLNYRLFSQSLCHELVHLKQFATNELYDYMNRNLTRWRNKLVDSEQMSYQDQPWEKEAYTREKQLYRWIHKHGEAKLLTKLKDIRYQMNRCSS